MITYQELMDHVIQDGNATDNEEARRALEAVTSELARHVDSTTREHLREQLPAALSDHVPAPRVEPALDTSGTLARVVAEQVGCPPEKGMRLAGAVLAGIRLGEPGLADELASQLPEELARWARDPEGARGRGDTGESGRPSRLDQTTLGHALDRLPSWEGDTGGLTREIELPGDRITPLLKQAERSARQLNHSFDHRVTDTGVAFTVRTASVGAVTTRDIEMAERIDEAVAKIGSGG